MDIGQKCLQSKQTNHFKQKIEYVYLIKMTKKDFPKYLRRLKLLVDVVV